VASSATGPTIPDREVLSRDVLIDGQRIHYEQAGTGHPVLLVHGIAASLVDWRWNIPALA
jgi:pimeloyl-ACP methyl ester carboxylesterase